VNHVINLELGPESTFLGYPTEVAGEMVCVLSSRAASDRAIQERVRRYMKAQGRDCGNCDGCPLGRAS
jgi:hypothetical protein